MTTPGWAVGRRVVIGVGNEFRRDDGIGPAVVGRLRERAPADVELLDSEGEPTSIIEAWADAALAIVVDAVQAEPTVPGRLHRFVVDRPGSGPAATVTSHGFGLDEAVGLAVALGRMPGRLIVHAVEVTDTSQGYGLTSVGTAAADALAAAVLADLA